jgi:hypothetical protein
MAGCDTIGRMSLATSFESIELDRLRAHFELVGVLLRAQPTEGVDVEARERTLALIDAYAERGVFPRNHIDPTRMLPSFVDAVGTRCAVAFLMEETEAWPLVERIRRRLNESYVAEMLGGRLEAARGGAGAAGLLQRDRRLLGGVLQRPRWHAGMRRGPRRQRQVVLQGR